MVKLTITYDTDRNSVNMSARMCGEMINHLDEIMGFIHGLADKNERMKGDR